MTIDTNLGITYNENFPTAGVDQSSQGFRDNFTVIKRAIENLQNLKSSASSALGLTTTLGSGGDVRVVVSFQNNAFRLPEGNPLSTPAAGMVRYQGNVAQFHDGTGWLSLLSLDTTGGIRLPSKSFLKLPTGFTADRPPVGEDGMLRYNTTLAQVEVYRLGQWIEVGAGSTREINADTGTFTGLLRLLTDATLDEHAMNRRSLRSFMSTALTFRTKGISAGFNLASNTVTLTAQPFKVSLTGVVVGEATINNLNDTVIETTIPDMLTLKDVRDEVGGLVKGTFRQPNANIATETGITVNYDEGNNTLELGVREFDINLTGAVQGSGHSSRLGNVTINTTTDLIRGFRISDDGVALGSEQSARSIDFVGAGVTASQIGNAVTVSIPAGLTPADVRDTVGDFVSGTIRVANTNTVTESGISVNYDATNNRLQLAPRDFTISLSGAVSGSGTVSRLGNTNIVTTTNLITGLTAFDEGLVLGTPQSVRLLNFTGGGITTTQSNDTLTINVPATLDRTAVRDTVGQFISGTIRDTSTQVSSESGITVNYDAENAVLELAPRDFNITLSGAITGSAKVSRLNNVAILTSADFIKGLSLKNNNVLLGTAVKTINVVGGNATVSGDTATLTLTSTVNEATIRQSVIGLIAGEQHRGLNAVYDSANNEIDLALKPISIRLQGAVRGNGTVTYTGNSTTDGSVTILTEAQSLGIEVRDEGNTAGNVRSVNFVGGGISTAVSIDGETATVFVPNSPGNEKFLLLDGGSANVPNARRFAAGTGIVINDGGPGGDFTISASSDAIIAKSRYLLDADLVGERAEINFSTTGAIYPEITDDPTNNRINVAFYSLTDGWYRPRQIDAGLITDKYGPSIDLGDLARGIIETDANMGTLVANDETTSSSYGQYLPYIY